MAGRGREAAGAALGLYAVLAAAFYGEARPWERHLFDRLNSGDTVESLRVPQQLGTPWSLVVVAVHAAVQRRPRDASVALAVLGLSKTVEVATKHLVERPRPVFQQPTVLRDDAPIDGGSFPSGHAAIAAATATLTWPHVSAPARVALAATLPLTCFARVRQGAHYPSDVVGGAALGLGLAAAVRAVLGVSPDEA